MSSGSGLATEAWVREDQTMIGRQRIGGDTQRRPEMTMTTKIARSAPLVVLAVGVLLLALTSALGGAPAPQVAADPQLGPPTWQRVLDAMDRVLDGQDITAAEIAWHAARGHAIESRQWDAFLAVGAGAL